MSASTLAAQMTSSSDRRPAAARSRDDRQLFFRRDGAMLAVDVEATAGDIQFGPERRLLEWEAAIEDDVSPSGDF